MHSLDDSVVAGSLPWHHIALYRWSYYLLCVIECKLQSQEVNCMVYLLISEKYESSSCRNIAGREVKLEMVNPSGNQNS